MSFNFDPHKLYSLTSDWVIAHGFAVLGIIAAALLARLFIGMFPRAYHPAPRPVEPLSLA